MEADAADQTGASVRDLLPHLICQLGISFRQHRLQVLKLFQEEKDVLIFKQAVASKSVK